MSPVGWFGAVLGLLALAYAVGFVVGYGMGGRDEGRRFLHEKDPGFYPAPRLGPVTRVLHGRAPDGSSG